MARAMRAIFSHRKTVMPKTAKKANMGVPPFNSRLPHQDYAAFRFSASLLLSLFWLCLARAIARQYRHGFALLRRSLQVHLVIAEYSPMISPKKIQFQKLWTQLKIQSFMHPHTKATTHPMNVHPRKKLRT